MKFETTVLVLGGGFSGITTAAKLKDAGITDFKVIDKAGDWGGNCGFLAIGGFGSGGEASSLEVDN